MIEIIAFLTAQYDEEEAAARASAEADPAPWTAYAVGEQSTGLGTGLRSGHGYGSVSAADDVDLWDCEGSSMLCMTAPTARHTAMHDPARVFVELEVKRARLKLHSPDTRRMPSRCLVCLSDRAGRMSDDWEPDVWPCKTVLLDAAVYVGRPGYQKEWIIDDD